MIIPTSNAVRIFISSESCGMYKIEQRILYEPDRHMGVYINNVPTLMDNGHPLYWIDKTEPIYTPDHNVRPLGYCKLTYIYHQEDVRCMSVQDVLREGYESPLDFYTYWCQNHDKQVLTNKRYGLGKMHKRDASKYAVMVLGLRPITSSAELRHPAFKDLKYDPDLPDIFHNYMPAMETDEELINFLFSEGA